MMNAFTNDDQLDGRQIVLWPMNALLEPQRTNCWTTWKEKISVIVEEKIDRNYSVLKIERWKNSRWTHRKDSSESSFVFVVVSSGIFGVARIFFDRSFSASRSETVFKARSICLTKESICSMFVSFSLISSEKLSRKWSSFLWALEKFVFTGVGTFFSRINAKIFEKKHFSFDPERKTNAPGEYLLIEDSFHFVLVASLPKLVQQLEIFENVFFDSNKIKLFPFVLYEPNCWARFILVPVPV